MGPLPLHHYCRVAGVTASQGCLYGWLCRVAHLPSLPTVAGLPGSSPPEPTVVADLPGSSPTRQNRSLALAASLFTKRQPNGCDFEGTYTSERFLMSRSVRRGQWVYRRGI